MKKPLILCILDGWGYREDKEYNAIAKAYTPSWDHIWNKHHRGLLLCSGNDVGLPDGQVGNSEVGHLHIGAGRVVLQDLEFINQNISTLCQNKIFSSILNQVKLGKNIHLIGLCSDGGVHSHIDHIVDIYHQLSKCKLQNSKIFLHFISDGRDSLPFLAETMLNKLDENKIDNIATLIGRYYAMDRNKDWDKTNLAFEAISSKSSQSFSYYNSVDKLKFLIKEQYKNELSDEFLLPMINRDYDGVKEDDIVLFCNFRIDRSVQLANLFVENNIKCYSITDYNIPEIEYIFPKTIVEDSLGKWISDQGLKQLRIAESEKFPHVTYFFSGNVHKQFAGEDRICIPSKNYHKDGSKGDIFSYDPKMSAKEITETIINKYEDYDFILVNYANPDIIGHTGDFLATVKAIEEIDRCLGEIISLDCPIIIASDHGNSELMYNEKTGQKNTKHTNNPVPIVFVNLDVNKLLKKPNLNYKNNVPFLGNLSIIKKLAIDMLS